MSTSQCSLAERRPASFQWKISFLEPEFHYYDKICKLRHRSLIIYGRNSVNHLGNLRTKLLETLSKLYNKPFTEAGLVQDCHSSISL